MLASVLGILLCVALSAYFSGTETAYASANELRMRSAAQSGGRARRWAYWIYMRYDNALTALLIGNNLVNNAASALATMVVMAALGSGYAWVATLLVTLLVLTFGEIIPKVVAKQVPERFATAAALPLRALMWCLHPVVVAVQWLMRAASRLWRRQIPDGPAVTEGDIEVLLDTAEDEGAIDENTTELLQSALEFDDVMAYEIITPRVDLYAVDIDSPMAQIVQEALRSPYSRVPVYQDSKDDIIGILHLNRFLKRVVDGDMDHRALRALLMPAYTVSRTATLPAVLATMRQWRCHMVVVSDEFGGTLGVLTMEDVLEELVGDIWDETDEVHRDFALMPDGRYDASGDLRLHDFFEYLDMDDRHVKAESTTLGGWAAENIGEAPKVGDAFDYASLHITVAKVVKRRVTRVTVTRA